MRMPKPQGRCVYTLPAHAGRGHTCRQCGRANRVRRDLCICGLVLERIARHTLDPDVNPSVAPSEDACHRYVPRKRKAKSLKSEV